MCFTYVKSVKYNKTQKLHIDNYPICVYTGCIIQTFAKEALMITNKNTADANIIVNIYFEDKAPVKGLHLTVPAERVICIRTDLPICEEEYQIPFGQYSLELESDVEICASFGRLDRRYNLGYYSTGYCVR